MKRNLYWLVVLGWISFSFQGCKENTSKSPTFQSELNRFNESINKAKDVKILLNQRADSLKVTNEFEALKIFNVLTILDENVLDLQKYADSIAHIDPLDAVQLIPIAMTQAEYVEALISSGQALIDNRSLSHGTWENKDPSTTKDSEVNLEKK